MKEPRRRFLLLIGVLLLAAQACLSGGGSPAEAPELATDEAPTAPDPSVTPPQPEAAFTPTGAAESEGTATPTGEPLTAEPILLWAAEVSASSRAGDFAYHPDRALGPPDTLACGDFVTAWQPAGDVLEAALTVIFPAPILAEEIRVAQSYQPGQIRRVAVIPLAGEVLTIFDAADSDRPAPADCPVTNLFWPEAPVGMIMGVEIALARPAGVPWTQIDAVGALGRAPESAAVQETPPALDGGDDFLEPTYFTNKNQITALAFGAEILWVGSEGGLVAWDLDSLTPTPFTAAEALPANAVQALALCQWSEPVLFAGGPAGVASLYPAGAPYFTALDHPGEAALGAVTALGCDDAGGQLWVGYQGHLSRYDPADQTWTEFGAAEGLPGDTVRGITTVDGDVWVAIAGGAAVLRDGEALEAFTPENSPIPSRFVHGIAGDGTGSLWMASSDGLVSYDPAGDSWSLWSSEEIEGGILADVLMGIVPGPGGALWLGDTFGTLCLFDPAEQACREVRPVADAYFSLTSLAAGPDGGLALGSFVHGLRLDDAGAWISLMTEDQAADNAFHAVAYAPDGRLWLAGQTSLQHFPAGTPGAPWETMPLPGDAQAHSLYVARDGLWIGHTAGARFLPYLPGEAVVDLPLGDPQTALPNTVTAITVDRAGRVYFGTSSGLSIWDGSQFHYADLLTEADRKKGAYPPRVNALYAEGQKVLVGADNGLYTFEDGVFRSGWMENLTLISSQNTRSVGMILPSPDGCGLLVGLGWDLACYTGVAFDVALTLPGEIRDAVVVDHTLWLATAGAGLYMVPVDSGGILWDLAMPGPDFTHRFGYQAIARSDPYTLWFAGAAGGLLRQRGMWGQ